MRNYLPILLIILSFQSKAQKTLFYIGSSSDKIPAPIALCSIDLSTGELVKIESFQGTESSGYLCISPDQKFLYSVNTEALDPNINSESVASFKIDQKTKSLTLINKQSVNGRGACHLSVTSDNKYLFVANYNTGNVVVLPIGLDGSLQPIVSNKQHEGNGPNTKRQEQAHAHYIKASADNNYVFAADLGTDKVMNYVLDKSTGMLSENPNQPFITTEPGAGPRNMSFHDNGKFIYILNELHSTLIACTYNSEKGIISILDTHPMLPAGFNGHSQAAAVHIHPSGKYVYASNRGHDSMAVFKIKKDGNIDRIQIIEDGIEWTREYNIEPSGKYMVVANRRLNEIRTFTIKSGKLTKTNFVEEFAQPTSVVFLK